MPVNDGLPAAFRRCVMHRKAGFLTSLLILGAVLTPVALATTSDQNPQPVREAIVNFSEATKVGGVFVMGPVLIVHDDRMYLGEPCTTIYRFEPGVGRGEALTTFACVPRASKAVEKFTMYTDRDPMIGCPVLTEFQFPGEIEAHGVPPTVID
jgi:uncharacterized membrane protein